MLRYTGLLGVLSLFFVGTIHAQDTLRTPTEAPEWGEVDEDLLRVTEYPQDSAASAVIVSKYGSARFQYDGDVAVDYHVRVKILDEGGYESGTIHVPFQAEHQEVDDVEGVTYTRGEDGTVQTHELKDDDIFEEEVDGEISRVRFTLPSLEPGAVLEYQYELESESLLYIPTWSFQHAQPTLYSEFQVRIPQVLQYVTLTTGGQDYATVDEEVKRTNRGRALQKRWVMKDVPALREEPFMTTTEDYRSRLRLQMKQLRDPASGLVVERFMTSWSDLAERLLDANYFGNNLGDGGGGLFGGEGALETKVNQLTGGLSSDSAKVRAIYDYVRSSIEWDGRLRQGRDQDFDEILESKTGNSAEINLLLVSLLQNAGLEAHPVLISTRDHGKVYPLYPFLSQFNSVIAAVDVPQKEDWVLLDATDPLCPVSLLPVRDLNRQGWLVREEDPQWIENPAPAHTNRQIYVRGELARDGTLTGQMNIQDRGYHAVDARRALERDDASTFVRDSLLRDVSDVALSNVSVKNADTLHAPLGIDVQIEAPGFGQTAGDMMYMKPRLAPAYTENPLRKKERTFPVDFAYPRRTTYILSLNLPEGYEVVEVPEKRYVKLPNDEGSFMRLVRAQGRQLMMRSAMELNEPRMPPPRYAALRELFTRMVSAQTEQVVLKQGEPTTAPSPASGGE